MLLNVVRTSATQASVLASPVWPNPCRTTSGGVVSMLPAWLRGRCCIEWSADGSMYECMLKHSAGPYVRDG